MKVKIKTGFTAYKENDLGPKAQEIHDDMEDDVADYPTPSPSLASVQTKINVYTSALTKKGKDKTAAKKKARKALTDALNQLALYVQQNCGNDEETALKSGFDIWKTGTPIGDLSKPKNFTLGPGENSGEVFVNMDGIHGAKSFVYRYWQDEGTDPSPKTIASTTTKALIDGLESGKKVSVQGAGVGASKRRVWSSVISIYVM